LAEPVTKRTSLNEYGIEDTAKGGLRNNELHR